MQKGGFAGAGFAGEKYVPVGVLDKIECKLQVGICNDFHIGPKGFNSYKIIKKEDNCKGKKVEGWKGGKAFISVWLRLQIVYDLIIIDRFNDMEI